MRTILIVWVLAMSACTQKEISGDDAGEDTAGYVPRPQPEDEPDFDADGFEAVRVGGPDCDDTRPWVNPDQPELCDGIDNNCNGLADGVLADETGHATSVVVCNSGEEIPE